jgi:hypothetical protein
MFAALERTGRCKRWHSRSKLFLQSQGILARQESEYLQVTPPGEPPQRWQEVENFADSGPNDRHYTLDSRTGRVQFGPLVREPTHLQEEVQLDDRCNGKGIRWDNPN